MVGLRLEEVLLEYLGRVESERERERSGEGGEKSRWLNIVSHPSVSHLSERTVERRGESAADVIYFACMPLLLPFFLHLYLS